MLKIVYLVLGWAALGLGMAGIVLPVLPTTPFYYSLHGALLRDLIAFMIG